ncbi:MAG: ABC transporter ATP-binding protein [Synergistaceae bacterium]
MIEITNLTTQYDANSQPALQNVTITIQKGEKIALLGENGSGKTTLLLAIVGLLPQTAGEIKIDGIKVEKKNLKEIRRKVGIIFQNPENQLFMPTVYQDINFGAINAHQTEEKAKEKTEEIIKYYELEKIQNKSITDLSGGEKRTTALAGILVMEPQYLLLDEPMTFLDAKSKRKLTNHIKQLTQGTIIATHDLDTIKELCTKVILIKQGKIDKQITTDQLLNDHETLKQYGYEE